jgi:prolipoprotein diacylglyceryltransferase
MYPDIYFGNTPIAYSFWVCIALAWLVFFWLLHRLSVQQGLSRKNIFTDSIVLFTISIFIFSRIFYILGNWVNDQFLIRDQLLTGDIIGFLKQFFIGGNYNLSFAGGVVWFLVVFFWKTWKDSKNARKYWDIIVPSFLIAASIGYLGALLGGQIYGSIAPDFPLSITYKNKIVPLRAPTFPLPVIYMMISLVLWVVTYRTLQKVHLPEWLLWYGSLGIFSLCLLVLEFWNGSIDIFSSKFGLNLVQILSLGLLVYVFVWILKITRT